MSTLREQALIEGIEALHRQHVETINEKAGYCQLTTRRGMLSNAETTYIEDHGCPVCKKGVHENTKGISGAANLTAALHARDVHEQQAKMDNARETSDTATGHAPGPVFQFAETRVGEGRLRDVPVEKLVVTKSPVTD